MTDPLKLVTALARDLVRLDSRSFVSNLAVAEAVEAALAGFAIERIDYTDPAGTAKRVLVARRGAGTGGLALAGHMDTVPDTGWADDPWSARLEGNVLHGLGSTDMKGPLAACIVAARSLPDRVPVTLLITTDEETTKQGASQLAERSVLAREAKPAAIVVAEPTMMRPLRGHRSHIHFTITATGVQAHSSTGRGRNANWDLVEFLVEMKALSRRLREDASLQDADYDPPFSDFNPVIDNHGAALNVTVPKATVRIKYRYTAKTDTAPVVQAVTEAAARAGLTLTMERDGFPPELPVDHPLILRCAALTGEAPLTAPYGTDAAELQVIAPCVVLGPGDIAEAHTPTEKANVAALAAAVPLFMRLAEQVAADR
jgi:acetylornithine deacetylase/succinyl-diaminopimelate desuccinylase-like protein